MPAQGGGGGGTPGTFGRATLASELNRIINGLYPDPKDYVGTDKAANIWAGTTNLSLVGALNRKAGITNPSLFKGLNAICNQLADTTGKEAVEALRSIRA